MVALTSRSASGTFFDVEIGGTAPGNAILHWQFAPPAPLKPGDGAGAPPAAARRPGAVPLSVNPLAPEPGYPVQAHIDMVRALFLAGMVLGAIAAFVIDRDFVGDARDPDLESLFGRGLAASGDEHHLGLTHGGGEVGGERESLLANVLVDQLLEARLVDGNFTGVERLDLGGIGCLGLSPVERHAGSKIRQRFYEVKESERLHAVGLLLKHGVQHPWVTRAGAYCWVL